MTLGADAPLGIFSYGLVSSGGRKTTSFRDSFTAHMEADELLVARHEAALDEYSRHNRLGDGEGGHYRIPRKSPPIALQMDITKAALLQELSQGRSAQCLASSDAGVVMSNRSGRGQQAVETVQTLTSLWDGQTHSLSRANITYRLSGRTLSVAWLAQPEFGEWLFSKRGEMGLSSRFLVCSDDHWKAPTITDEKIDALVSAEAANQGIPPVDPVLQGFWGIISAVRAIQDEGLEYRPDASLRHLETSAVDRQNTGGIPAVPPLRPRDRRQSAETGKCPRPGLLAASGRARVQALGGNGRVGAIRS